MFLWVKNHAGVWEKCNDECFTPYIRSHFANAGNQFPMTQMNAVKCSYGDYQVINRVKIFQ